MNALKKYAGLLWMIMAPLAIFYLFRTAAGEIAAKPGLDTKIQWVVFIVIFIPIAIGFAIFGYYAWKGEYSYLPEEAENN
jgi:hypothetical protein